MEIGRFVIVAVAAVVSGCMLPIRSDLTATVEGVIGKNDIHEIAENYFATRESFWTKYGSRRGQLLHVRLSTSIDMVSFSVRKSLVMSLRWRFCDNAQQWVRLGAPTAFVNGATVWNPLSKPSSALDKTGRFVYDAVLYVRDRRSEEERRIEAFGVVEEAFDLEIDPRDVCVRMRMKTIPGGYRTKAARISKEEIAAALGVDVPSARRRKSEIRPHW